MHDIELESVQLHQTAERNLSATSVPLHEEQVITENGQILVAVQGSRGKPAIITYHDLGLNHVSGFQAFFNYADMRNLLDNFCVYHVNAPGQQVGAPALPIECVFPTMDELANQLNYVFTHFNLKAAVGFGVGVGANILARFAHVNPDKMVALCLVNCVSTQAGWIEWGYQKLNASYLRSKGMTQGVIDYLLWYHFGNGTEERNHDLVQVYKSYFLQHVNPSNLALFIDSYIRRNDLNISRGDNDGVSRVPGEKLPTLRMPVMNITGAFSPHVEDTVTFNGRLDPTNSTWMKVSDCGMILEEQPGKVAEAFRLFLQSEGYRIQSK